MTMDTSEGSYVFTERAIESLTMDTSEGFYVFTQRAIESLTMDTSEGSMSSLKELLKA